MISAEGKAIILNQPLLQKLRGLSLEFPKDYNYKTGDIIFCHNSFYTFKEALGEGDIHVFDHQGYDSYLKAAEISGSINIDDYPELFL